MMKGQLFWIFIISISYLTLLGCGQGVRDIYENECLGSTSGLSSTVGSAHQYGLYRKMYTNCTLVRENLIIVFIQLFGEEYDFDFLESIREVNGYVLIRGNFVNTIRLSNLRVIRGWKTYSESDSDPRKYSLYVVRNAHPQNDSIGLRDLRLNSLSEILEGDVLFQGNRLLCYGERTIDWTYIFHGRTGAQVMTPDDEGYPKTNCTAQCHENCENGGQRFCWGPGSDMCQRVVSCGNTCGRKARCFKATECCHTQCLAGCTAEKDDAECLSCRNFVDDDKCVERCNVEKYNPGTKQWDPPSVKKYIYGTKCVEKCPANMLKEDEACVSTCKKGNMENKTDSGKRECIFCGGTCPKTCSGTAYWMSGKNIAQFNQCTKVEGKLVINNMTFQGHHDEGEPITVDDLELLKDVDEITGVLDITAWHENLTSLSFLRNLRVIGGQDSGSNSLRIMSTNLDSAELISLQEVTKGNVYISRNPRLCYVNTINWTSIFTNKDGPQAATVRNNRDNYACIAENRTCSPLCSSLSCWGPGDDMCVSCLNYSRNGRCVAECPLESGFYTVQTKRNIECRPCHPECKGGCMGDDPANCTSCRHVRNEGICEKKCPSNRYKDDNGTCQWCEGVCDECEGPSSKMVPGGCTKCQSRIVMKETKECLMNGSECDNLENHYQDKEHIQYTSCRKCHEECNGCNGSQNTDCFQCRNYGQPTKSGKMECVANCTYDNGFYNVEGLMSCAPCHNECKQCYGPTEFQCTLCRNVRIYESRTNEDSKDMSFENTGFVFRCVEQCPNGQFLEKQENDGQYTCKANLPKWTAWVIASGVFIVIVAVIIIILVVYVRQQTLRRRKESVLAQDEIPMISAGKARPNMSLLRLIKESELRRGNIIGSGAFGTVFKGVWIPEKENIKIPIAIKVLQETSNTNLNVELLDEARIMATVCHPYCVRILAVCMTAQMMLITQLMPLGCLLDYVRKEKSNIGSRALLLWSVQIAKGMKYLEELGIIHRDLAARNVLVHNPNQVKITDFGLAKLLDCEEEIISEGGKMPIKWLALECIQHRIYTHKSDVWSYGVTLWETFTYGERPYGDTPARQIPHALEKGERLPQPAICTIDVYMIMIKCWMLDIDSRPSFADLVTEFTKMAQDPGRFLVIQGDKLMRLPSCKPNAKDLFRMISLPADDLDLMIVSGEDYLRPMDLELDIENHYDNPPTTPLTPLGQLTIIPEDENYEKQRPLISDGDDDEIDKLTYISGKNPIECNRKPSLQRYISDPCQNDHQGNNQAYTNPVVQVDADGYLPPKSLAVPNYLDVVDQTSDDPNGKSLDPQLPMCLDMIPTSLFSKDNPEYYLTSRTEEDGTCHNAGDSSSSNMLLTSGKNKDSNPKQTEYYNVPGNPVKTSQPYARLPETDI